MLGQRVALEGVAAAREGPHGCEPEASADPQIRVDRDRRCVDAIGECAARLAEAVRARLAETGRSGQHDGSGRVVEHRELVPLGDGDLMDVAADDQLGAGGGQRLEDEIAARQRALPAPPRRTDELVVQDGDPHGSGCGGAEPVPRPRELHSAHAAGLVVPGANRVQAHDQRAVAVVHRLGRPPLPLELLPRGSSGGTVTPEGCRGSRALRAPAHRVRAAAGPPARARAAVLDA